MDSFSKLFSERMTRKEFLVRIGLMLFVLSGVGSALHSMKQIQKQPAKRIKLSTKASTSFGQGVYGT